MHTVSTGDHYKYVCKVVKLTQKLFFTYIKFFHWDSSHINLKELDKVQIFKDIFKKTSLQYTLVVNV